MRSDRSLPTMMNASRRRPTSWRTSTPPQRSERVPIPRPRASGTSHNRAWPGGLRPEAGHGSQSRSVAASTMANGAPVPSRHIARALSMNASASAGRYGWDVHPARDLRVLAGGQQGGRSARRHGRRTSSSMASIVSGSSSAASHASILPGPGDATRVDRPLAFADPPILNHMVQYSSGPARRLVRRALGRHPARRAGAARAWRRLDHGPGREVPHDPHRHEEARRHPGAGRARHHREGRPRADLQARPAPARGGNGMDRAIPPALGRALRSAGPGDRGTETEGERWTQEESSPR